MKNLLLVFALLIGSIGFSQNLIVKNYTSCTKYVYAEWADGSCNAVPGAPGGWISIPPLGSINITTAAPGAGDLLRVRVTSAYMVETCEMIVLDNIFSPCWAGPITGTAHECMCGGTLYTADINSSMPGNHLINIY